MLENNNFVNVKWHIPIFPPFNQTNCDRILDEIAETIPKYNKKWEQVHGC